MRNTPNDPSTESHSEKKEVRPARFCGIVRPIAEMGTYSAKHWREVHNVISEAVEPLGFTLRLVSESDAAGVILTEIVSNLYQDEIVIVDVSGRNPNVMFELGMRLAFEKPAIIVMDDDTPFSFDISPVKHIRYPRTLRYADVVKFKTEVAFAVKATLEAGPEKKNYLQQFGPIKVTELGTQSIDLSALAQDVQEMKRLMAISVNHFETHNSDRFFHHDRGLYAGSEMESSLRIELPDDIREAFLSQALDEPNVQEVEDVENGFKFLIKGRPNDVSETRNRLRIFARELKIANIVA